jgi:hypothetical protein
MQRSYVKKAAFTLNISLTFSIFQPHFSKGYRYPWQDFYTYYQFFSLEGRHEK